MWNKTSAVISLLNLRDCYEDSTAMLSIQRKRTTAERFSNEDSSQAL
jgi:hypothetical protein